MWLDFRSWEARESWPENGVRCESEMMGRMADSHQGIYDSRGGGGGCVRMWWCYCAAGLFQKSKLATTSCPSSSS